MNRKRRNQIKKVLNGLQTCSNDLETIKDEEDGARENLPENLQSSESYSSSEDSSDVLDTAIEDINEVIENLESLL